MKEYIVIIADSVGYDADSFDTKEDAMEYAIKNNYGKDFTICKRLDYTLVLK